MEFDIHRLFEEGYPGLKVSARIGSAADYQQVIEEFFPVIRDQLNVRFKARMRKEGAVLHEADLEEETDIHKWMVEGLIAGFLGGSVVVAIWAAFEQGVDNIAEYVREKEGLPLRLCDLKDGSLRQKTEKYLFSLTRTEFTFPDSLADVQFLRNIYAHHNGDTNTLSVEQRKKAQDIVRSTQGVSFVDDHQIVIQSTYLQSCVSRVDSCLDALLRFAESKYPYENGDGK